MQSILDQKREYHSQHVHKYEQESGRAFWLAMFLLAIFATIVVAGVLAHTGNLTVFEDGSFRLLNSAGCIPAMLCN